jgi:NADPH2:quinone reductase
MKAQVINDFGKALEVFQETNDLQIPYPQENEIQIQVLASSVNDLDTKIRNGDLGFMAPEFPAILHGDVAGIVTGIGKNVTRFKKGDKVFGFIGGIKGYSGGLSDFITADERFFSIAPNSSSFAELGSLPLVGITAYEAIIERACVERGQTVLIYGATGGVGHLALQLAKLSGAKVFAVVVNQEQVDIARELGADETIIFSEKEVKTYVHEFTNGLGFDIVVDTVGLQNFPNALEAVKVAGKVINTFAYINADLTSAQMKGVSLHFIAMLIPLFTNINKEKYGQILSKYASWLDEKKLTVLVDEKSFSFTEVGLAHQYYESKKAKGKIVLLK